MTGLEVLVGVVAGVVVHDLLVEADRQAASPPIMPQPPARPRTPAEGARYYDAQMAYAAEMRQYGSRVRGYWRRQRGW